MRLPLQTTIEARSTNETKDSLTVNGFVEIESQTERYAFKRPGTTSKNVGGGTAKGIFFYNGVLYSWDSSTGNLTPDLVSV